MGGSGLGEFKRQRDDNVRTPTFERLWFGLGSPTTITPREQAMGCLQSVTAGDGDEGQRLKVEAFQAGVLACVRDFLDGSHSRDIDELTGLAPTLGLVRNRASF